MDLLNMVMDNHYLLGDAMNGLVSTGKSIIKWLQRGAIVATAIAFCIGGYHLILGGMNGRQKCIPWFIGGAAGCVIIAGCLGLAESVDANIKF
ncbi:hypothetical protein NSQ76_20170 [Bacillus sp. FSL M8-0256]|uniref:hypothetical protein n=1 Tax=Bacillus sp. FSL M8-0256 TaxID=2954578 RepID=UPI0030FC4D9B